MANSTKSNPYVCDSTGAVITKPTTVREIQWVDDDGDIVHDSTLTLVVNGETLTFKIQPVNDQLGFGAVAWRAGPFNPGIMISDLTISAMAQGHLHIWI